MTDAQRFEQADQIMSRHRRGDIDKEDAERKLRLAGFTKKEIQQLFQGKDIG